MAFIPFDPEAELYVHHEKLPHWRQHGTTYFVTARLADSLPKKVLKAWQADREAWLLNHGIDPFNNPDPVLPEEVRAEFSRIFTARFHRLLDAGHGECILADPRCSVALAERLLAGHKKAYFLDAWCIMPNHFHALVEPTGKTDLGEIMRHWKGGSAFSIHRLLGRRGTLWLKETFDHIVRSEAQLKRFRQYIAANPVKAGLQQGFVVGMGEVVYS